MTDDHQQTGARRPDPARPPAGEPVGTRPSGTEPSGTEPSGTEPPGTEPSGTEPVGTLLSAGEPGVEEPEPPEPPRDRDEPDGGALDGGALDGGDAAAGVDNAAPAAAADTPAAEAGTGISRRRRVSAAGAVIGLLLGLLGFALVVQLRSNAADEQLSTERPEDLVRILSDLDARKDRLSQEITKQQDLKQQLTAGSQSRQAALAEASQRADELGILAGTLGATGTGLRIEFRAAGKPIRASDVLDAIEELRGAGAEAMQIAGKDGAAVRIVASTSFVDGSGGTLLVDGRTLTGPYTVTVIGDPQTMQIALSIPSGVVDTVRNDGGTVSVVASGTVQVTALHQNTPPRFAKPVG